MIDNLRPAKAPAITASHAPLTAAWATDVRSLEAALGRIADARIGNDCRVTFFEVKGDQDLHVNVTRQYATDGVKGWSGPGVTAGGLVYNRTFTRMPRYQLLREIRNVIFATPA